MSLNAFDSDVLIYAATDLPDGAAVAALFATASGVVGVGSVLLLPELLAFPLRHRAMREYSALVGLLSRLDLRVTDRTTGELAVQLGADHGLRAADAVHLATAVLAGADRFVTNNRKDFPRSLGEVQITYPEDL